MYSRIHDISKIKFRLRAVWFVTLLLFVMAWRQLQDLFVYTLSKLYEFFIQHNAIKP